MPPWIPFHGFCVAASGIVEIVCGIGVLIPATRRIAAWGLIALLIAVTTLGFTLRWFVRDRITPPPPHGVLPVRAVGLGALGGFTTFIAHSGGPPVAMYLLGRNLDKTVFAGTTVALFLLGNLIKLGPFVKLGLDNKTALAAALVFAPIAPIGVLVGKALHDRLDQERLYFWCYTLLAVTGLKLLWDSLRAFG